MLQEIGLPDFLTERLAGSMLLLHGALKSLACTSDGVLRSGSWNRASVWRCLSMHHGSFSRLTRAGHAAFSPDSLRCLAEFLDKGPSSEGSRVPRCTGLAVEPGSQDRDALRALHIGCGTSTLGVELARQLPGTMRSEPGPSPFLVSAHHAMVAAHRIRQTLTMESKLHVVNVDFSTTAIEASRQSVPSGQTRSMN